MTKHEVKAWRNNIVAMISVSTLLLVLLVIGVILGIMLISINATPTPLAMYITMIVTLVIGGIGSFVMSIIILQITWKIEHLNISKLLWGYMGLFLLGPIASLIFYSISLKSFNDYINENHLQ